MKKTQDQTTIKPCMTPEELIAHCRVAEAMGKKRVFATKELMKHFIGESGEASFTMMRVEVVEMGREGELDKRDDSTIEQVNFPQK